MEFSDVIKRRKMVHVFEQRAVDPALIDRLLDTARRGPSAGFSQGYDFVVLDTAETLAAFWTATTNPAFPPEPGEVEAGPTVVVLLVSDASRYIERYSQPDKIDFGLDRAEAWPVPFWDTDAAMAGMLLLLAAVDAGLGSWYFGIGYGEDTVRQQCAIPDGHKIVGVVGLGYAGVDDNPRGSAHSLKRRPLDEMIHRGTW